MSRAVEIMRLPAGALPSAGEPLGPRAIHCRITRRAAQYAWASYQVTSSTGQSSHGEDWRLRTCVGWKRSNSAFVTSCRSM